MKTPTDKRIELQLILEAIAGQGHVFFQPPSNIHMSYPAIVYSRHDVSKKKADNAMYLQSRAYKLIIIDEDPDSELIDKVAKLPMCSFSTHYVANNLNHDAFIIYY